ncbi:acid protease [Suillus decipiens]|nr:acid protease [Suillus decipiens]
MFPAASLLTLFLLVLSITGSPIKAGNSPVTIPMTKRLKFSNDTTNNILARDRARVKTLMDPSTRGHRFSNVHVTSNDIGYTVSIGVGQPPTNYTLLVDTGSANTWIGASTPYVPTGSSISIGPVGSIYGSGYFAGTEYLDIVTLSPELAITPQSIGVATASDGIDVDGILGIGPTDLTLNTLQNHPTQTIPTVTDNLYEQVSIPAAVLGIFFQPEGGPSGSGNSGELTFGGADPTRCNGGIVYTPITKSNPSSKYWGIDQKITYGSTTILSSAAGIVDSGTTNIMIASDAYHAYQTATGATVDHSTGLLTVTSEQYGALKNLDFHIGGQIFTLTPNGQIWPRSLNAKVGGQEGSIYLIVCEIDNDMEAMVGYHFVNGYVFMQRFYVVFDTTNSRVGFARTPFTHATTN